jgi:hypothetical protein
MLTRVVIASGINGVCDKELLPNERRRTGPERPTRHTERGSFTPLREAHVVIGSDHKRNPVPGYARGLDPKGGETSNSISDHLAAGDRDGYRLGFIEHP